MGAERQERRAETARGLLITQRSQVQILPPLPSLQVRGLSRFREGPSCCGVLTSLLTALGSGDSLLCPAWATIPDLRTPPSSRFGIEAGSGGSLLCSAPVRAAGSVAVIRSELGTKADGRWA
jgi:hypothetical protein